MKKIAAFTALLFISALTIISCSESTSPDGYGRVKMYLVDAPSTVESVFIEVLRVEVHSEKDGWVVINDVPDTYDLLTLTNGVSAVLGEKPLPSGKYTQVRLVLGENNYLYDNGTRFDLVIPSGQQSGLKLIHPFVIEPDNLYEMYLDFNVDKSVEVTGSGKYMLKPTIRVQAAVVSGTISGIVLPADADATISVTVDQDVVSTYTDSLGYFKLVALPEGTYDVSIVPAKEGLDSTVVPDVIVVKQQNTDIGTITLQ